MSTSAANSLYPPPELAAAGKECIPVRSALSHRAGLAPESIARCHTEQWHGPGRVLGVSSGFGLGFMLSQPAVRGGAFGPGSHTFGDPGAGGSVGFANPDRHVGFSYVMNRMDLESLLDPRAARLIDAMYASLG